MKNKSQHSKKKSKKSPSKSNHCTLFGGAIAWAGYVPSKENSSTEKNITKSNSNDSIFKPNEIKVTRSGRCYYENASDSSFQRPKIRKKEDRVELLFGKEKRINKGKAFIKQTENTKNDETLIKKSDTKTRTVCKGSKPKFGMVSEPMLSKQEVTENEGHPLKYDAKRKMYYYGKSLDEVSQTERDKKKPKLLKKTDDMVLFSLKQ